MKLNLYIVITAMVVLFPIHNFAQNSNSQNILGCWKITSIEYFNPEDKSDEVLKEALNCQFCFEQNNKFSTRLTKKSTVTGNYRFSKDGKMLFQNRDESEEGTDLDCEVISLDQKKMVLKTEFATLYLKKE